MKTQTTNTTPAQPAQPAKGLLIINDDQKLIGARTEFNSPIPFYDDGYGALYAHFSSCGNFSFIDSIIRARTWEDAFSIWEDEFALEPDPSDITEEALIAEYGEEYSENALFQEAYGYRSNTGKDKGILYAKDLSVDHLERVTSAFLEIQRISVFVREFEEEEIAFVPSLLLM
jgi:hypothetical protein